MCLLQSTWAYVPRRKASTQGEHRERCWSCVRLPVWPQHSWAKAAGDSSRHLSSESCRGTPLHWPDTLERGVLLTGTSYQRRHWGITRPCELHWLLPLLSFQEDPGSTASQRFCESECASQREYVNNKNGQVCVLKRISILHLWRPQYQLSSLKLQFTPGNKFRYWISRYLQHLHYHNILVQIILAYYSIHSH